MIVAGLLSTKSEVMEIQYIAKICAVKKRIHFLARREAIKQLLRKENCVENTKD
jgi:hypothetical protein